MYFCNSQEIISLILTLTLLLTANIYFMKNLFLLGLAGFLSYSTIYAQEPVLTRNKMMTFGSITQMADVSESTIDLIDFNQTGENQVWDFSEISNADPNKVYISTIERPVNTPYYTNYPLSNYVMVEKTLTDNIETNLRYNYYLLSDTQLERLGSTNSTTKESSTYSNPQTEYVFPLSYGTTNEDTWKASFSFFTGYASLECIGTGTLKLPNGVYENVFMVHLVIDDNVLILSDNYFWLSENGALLVAYYIIDYVLFTDVSAMYSTNTNIVTGLKSIKSIVNNIQYNNPVKNTLELKMETTGISAGLKLSLTNTLGKTVLTKEVPSFSSGINTINLDLSDLDSGVYFLAINISESSSKPEIVKIIKQ